MKFLAGVAAAVLVAIGALFIVGMLVDPENYPGGDAEVIPPGREAQVMELLAPLNAAGFAGLSVDDVQITSGAIRLQLAAKTPSSPAPRCQLPSWARAPGGLLLEWNADAPRETGAEACVGSARAGDLRLTWFLDGAAGLQGEAERRVAQLVARHPEAIWLHHERVAMGLGALLATRRGERCEGLEFGMLTPMIRATRLRGAVLAPLLFVVLGLTTALLGVWLAREWKREAAPAPAATTARGGPNRVALIAGALLVVVGGGLRVRAEQRLRFDPGDTEPGFPSAAPALACDWDTETHPPLFRVLEQGWMRATGLRVAGESPRLRVPTLVLSTLALLFATVAVVVLRRSAWALVPLVPLALGPDFVDDSVLARPYALVVLFSVIVLVMLYGTRADGEAPESMTGLRWAVALAAAGLCSWSDPVAGAVAGTWIALRLVDKGALPRRRRWLGSAAVLCVGLAWSAPLIPGALDAARWQAGSAGSAAGSAAATASRGAASPSGRGHFGASQPGFVKSALAFALVGREASGAWIPGALVLVVLTVLAAASARASFAVAPWLCVAMMGFLSSWIAMRPRNVLFFVVLVRLGAAFVLPVARGPWRRLLNTLRRAS